MKFERRDLNSWERTKARNVAALRRLRAKNKQVDTTEGEDLAGGAFFIAVGVGLSVFQATLGASPGDF